MDVFEKSNTETGSNWARVYRPRNLNEYMGQAIKEKMLSRLKDPKHYPRVIMLEGTRGSGKTSLARLISKQILCLDKTPDGLACEHCEMCEELNQNLLYADSDHTVDNVLEVDAAMDGGKDAVGRVIDYMDTEPLLGDYKVCILDECHKLTATAQNALLKRLEEPKSYEIYILCTTEADKILQTIKSRCEVTLHIKPASLEDLSARLIEICKREGVEIGTEAVKAIANACNRNPRESILKLQDLAMSHNYKVTIADVLRETGSVDAEEYIEYFTCVNKGLEYIVQYIGKMKEKNITGLEFFKGLTNFVISCIYITMGVGLDRYDAEYVAKVKKFFKMYNTEDIDCLLQILEYARKLVSSDDSMQELVLLTTSLRIGKIKLLSVGLYNEALLADKENQKGNKKHLDNMKKNEDATLNKDRNTVLDDSLLASTFGKELVEVKNGNPSLLFDDEDDEDDEDDTVGGNSLASDMSFLADFEDKFNK